MENDVHTVNWRYQMISCRFDSSHCEQRPQRRSVRGSLLHSILLSAVVLLSVFPAARSSVAQELFIGDVADNSVKHFDVGSGTYLGAIVPSSTAGLRGPMGVVVTDGQLVVVNQNVNTGSRGEILKFDATSGIFLGKLVSSSDRNAPFFPQGIVRGGPDQNFYVADVGVKSGKCANQGDVKIYNAAGAFLGNLDRQAFTAEFHPRGVVFGPDGLLYVSTVGCLEPKDPSFNRLTGYILRFNPVTRLFVDVFASDATVPDLHRPEALVFDSQGNLWVTSFQGGTTPNDNILKLNRHNGHLIDEIPLLAPDGSRAPAQAIIFGPGGNLFVAVTSGAIAGAVLRCNPANKQCSTVIDTGGPLLSPWFLVFRNSDPATLSYIGQ